MVLNKHLPKDQSNGFVFISVSCSNDHRISDLVCCPITISHFCKSRYGLPGVSASSLPKWIHSYLKLHILCVCVWQFFFRLFADCEKEPPQLDYTQMLLYFACHPDTLEGVYRALSVAVGTHIFRQVETPMLMAEKVTTWHKRDNFGEKAKE